MAAITVQEVDSTGIDLNFVAAAGGGDTFDNSAANTTFFIKNDDASQKTVTFQTDAVSDGDLAITDRAITVDAGDVTQVGPFNTNVYGDVDNIISVTYSDVTSVTVAASKPKVGFP